MSWISYANSEAVMLTIVCVESQPKRIQLSKQEFHKSSDKRREIMNVLHSSGSEYNCVASRVLTTDCNGRCTYCL